MQRIGQALARFGAARALLAGAAILAGAAGPVRGTTDSSEDTALAIPRISTAGKSAPVALPQPLPPSEAGRIRRIFALQAKNDIPAAVAECQDLTDTTLLGDILADRYLGGPNRAQPAELQAWLALYADLPDAPGVRALLASQVPHGAALPALPEPLATLPPVTPGSEVEPVERLLQRNPALDRSVHEAARVNANGALRLIARTRGLSREYGAQLRAEVAQVLFTQGQDSQAYATAEAANRQADGEVGLAAYVAGLAAWRLERPDLARPLFEAAFAARLTQPAQRAGAAFWAARAHLRTRNPGGYAPWLQRAAENPRTFYGLLSRRALGRQLRTDPDMRQATLGEADVEAIDAMPDGRRAFALLQVGQDARAAAALQQLWARTRDKPGFTRSILLVAKAAGLSGLAEQLTALLEPASVYLPRRLRPAGGFRTDPALLYALARLESNFDAEAVSPMGARGLLQLMPRTVDFILGDDSPRGRRLHDPGVNLELGQRYLLMLAQYDLVGADLIRLLATYNSGPGSFGRWAASIKHNGDPLLFIESIPSDETRAYVPRVLAYSWLYAAELDLPAPSLDELAAGSWPRFRPLAATRHDVLARLR
ncbi:MAG TPA: lytic transglycosylase domain-containing protein [Acetobacteraceae bacterium]|jgi:soluble lytic murein transglycosylase-like protein|nr:lytic transglycosylase domain-containing protein [Acetobacteraceae bacterium]